jgi:hypothetical protein
MDAALSSLNMFHNARCDYGFFNAVVGPIHSKAMRVILGTEEERDVWMRAVRRSQGTAMPLVRRCLEDRHAWSGQRRLGGCWKDLASLHEQHSTYLASQRDGGSSDFFSLLEVMSTLAQPLLPTQSATADSYPQSASSGLFK